METSPTEQLGALKTTPVVEDPEDLILHSESQDDDIDEVKREIAAMGLESEKELSAMGLNEDSHRKDGTKNQVVEHRKYDVNIPENEIHKADDERSTENKMQKGDDETHTETKSSGEGKPTETKTQENKTKKKRRPKKSKEEKPRKADHENSTRGDDVLSTKANVDAGARRSPADPSASDTSSSSVDEDPNTVDNSVYVDSRLVCNELIAAAGKPNSTELSRLLREGRGCNVTEGGGVTPLHVAAGRGLVDNVKILIRAGGNVRAPTDDRMTPLHFAARNHVNTLDDAMAQAFRMAMMTKAGIPEGSLDVGHAAVVKELVAAGADVDAADSSGWRPLHLAVSYGSLKTTQALLEARADVNARTFKAVTALYASATSSELMVRGRDEHAEALLRAGADVHAAIEDGFTPLHAAAYFADWKVARVLLLAGADRRRRDKRGLTPRDVSNSMMVDIALESNMDELAVTSTPEGLMLLYMARRK